MNTIKSQPTKIKIIGIGSGGNNTIDNLLKTELNGVEYYSIRTNNHKEYQPHPLKKILSIGGDIINTLGASASVEDGKKIAEFSLEDIKSILKDTDMVFLTTNMGRGMGTGAISIISKIAKDLGILTITIVTKPFRFEGLPTLKTAEKGINQLKPNTDALIVINNDNLINNEDKTLTMKEAFKISNDVLFQTIQEIITIITKIGYINADFADLRTVLKNAGNAFIGIGRSAGKNRLKEATLKAMNSKLLSNTFEGATKVLLNIKANVKISLEEINLTSELIKEKADSQAHIIWGMVLDESLNDEIIITIIASNCENSKPLKENTKSIHPIKIANVQSHSIYDVENMISF